MVHVYSSRYMIGESRYNRFFAVIALFTFSMILLVMSGNLLILLISWEVMGICSYLLISHAAERPSACLHRPSGTPVSREGGAHASGNDPEIITDTPPAVVNQPPTYSSLPDTASTET